MPGPIASIQQQVHEASLLGHRAPVISLSLDKSNSTLASGSEDGSIRLWDTTTLKTKTGIRPQLESLASEDLAITSMVFGQNQTLYASVSNRVIAYDLRSPSLILTKPDQEWIVSNDEVNQIVLSENGQTIAFGDDEGTVGLIDLRQNNARTTVRKLNGQHDNICSTLCFRPSKPDVLVTGGADHQLISWDISTRSRTRALNMSTFNAATTTNFNPPFVNVIKFSQGRFLVAGLGDGSVYVEDCFVGVAAARGRNSNNKRGQGNNSQQLNAKLWRGGHGWSISAMDVLENDAVITAGIDGKLNRWRMHDLITYIPERRETEQCITKTLQTGLKMNAIASMVCGDAVTVFAAGVNVDGGIETNNDKIMMYKM